MGAKKINPKFDAAKLQQHVHEIAKAEPPTEHSEILEQLLTQLEPVEFEELAFPQAKALKRKIADLEERLRLPDGRFNSSEELEPYRKEWKQLTSKLEKLKLAEKHLIVLAVDQTQRAAEKHSWSLCKNNDFIYLYNGAFWKELDKEALQKFLGEAAERLGVPRFSARYFQFREKLLKQFISASYLPTPEINNDSVLINLKNGTFEITTKGHKIRPYDSADFLTYQLPFEFDENAKAPIFEAYLNKVLPDIEKQRVLAEYLGYVFVKHGTSTLKEEKALILYGTGANGKSVFFEIVNALLGLENVSSYSLQSLTNETGYFRAKLANKLLNYASEINGKLEVDVFKQLVSGEPVEARLPYGQPFILRQYAKLIFNCNELPTEVEHTNAFFRRFLIIPFDVTIPEAEQDKTLHSRIIENELSGVFNWVLAGLNRLLEQQRFSKCEAAERAVEQYKTESDSVKMFLQELGYEKHPTYWKPYSELYTEYRSYCMESGTYPVKKLNFGKRLASMDVLFSRHNTHGKTCFLKRASDL